MIESKPDHFLDDLRLNNSWPELRRYRFFSIHINVFLSTLSALVYFLYTYYYYWCILNLKYIYAPLYASILYPENDRF